MKIKSTVSFVLASLLVLALGVASVFAVGGYDLSTNNSFESALGTSSIGSPLRNWYKANGAGRFSTTLAHTGDYVTYAVTDNNYPGTVAIRASHSPKYWNGGTTIKVTGWVFLAVDDGNESVKLKASFGNSDSYTTSQTVTCVSNPAINTWTPCEYEFSIPSGYQDMKLEVKAYSASDVSVFYFDDFVAEKCDLTGGGCDYWDVCFGAGTAK